MDSNHLAILNLLDNSLSLLDGHVCINSVLVSTVYETDQEHLFELTSSKIKVLEFNFNQSNDYFDIFDNFSFFFHLHSLDCARYGIVRLHITRVCSKDMQRILYS